MAAAEDDWRLEQLRSQKHLHRIRLERKPYRAYRPGWDHDHCVACTAQFAEQDLPNERVLKEGYATCDDYVHGAEYDWVCPECFLDLKDALGWQEATAST